jgi:hypothetical protein
MSFGRRADRLEQEFARFNAPTVTSISAADLTRGGTPHFARVYDRKGREVGGFDRLGGESLSAFTKRARAGALGIKGASRLLVGGLGAGDKPSDTEELPAHAVVLPDIPLHPSQLEAVDLIERSRRVCLVAGRRWGKSTVIAALAVGYAIAGKNSALFAPTYRFLKPLMDAVALAVRHLPGVTINLSHGEIKIAGGGVIDGWSLDHTGRSARGRKYHICLVDEAGHDEGYLAGTLQAAITPSTLDYRGKIVLASTPNGLEGAFWECANMPERGYVTFHAPTSANPHLPPEEIEYMRSTLRPEIAAQELDAQFVDVSGSAILPLGKLLIDGKPYPDDGWRCAYLGVAIDSNSGKGGEGRDGCAAVVFALTTPDPELEIGRIIIVDWTIASLTQGGVVDWLESVRAMAMEWYAILKPMWGGPEAHIELAGNGPSLFEIAKEMSFYPHDIDSKLVSLGKDNRALAVEPHATQGRLKIGAHALDKRMSYRGLEANHLVRQVTGFKAFDKDAYKREDDLFDATTYAALVGLGDGRDQQWAALDIKHARMRAKAAIEA